MRKLENHQPHEESHAQTFELCLSPLRHVYTCCIVSESAAIYENPTGFAPCIIIFNLWGTRELRNDIRVRWKFNLDYLVGILGSYCTLKVGFACMLGEFKTCYTLRKALVCRFWVCLKWFGMMSTWPLRACYVRAQGSTRLQVVSGTQLGIPVVRTTGPPQAGY
jgi:hypothetical protein